MGIKYNNIFAIVICILVVAFYIINQFFPSLNLHPYTEFPKDFASIKEKPILIINLFTFIFEYNFKINQMSFIFDILILLLASYLVEKRIPYFIIVVFFLSIVLVALLKLFIFKNFVLKGLNVVILSYLFSSFFIALKDKTVNITSILIIAAYIYLSVLKKELMFSNISSFTEIIAAFLASISVFILKEKKENEPEMSNYAPL